MEEILTRLGMEVNALLMNSSWQVSKSPAYRFRYVSLEEDLLEELARIYGYNNRMPVLFQYRDY